MNEKRNNIIICFTIMQMVIAKKIIEASNEEFIGVVLFPGSSEKGKYYSNCLKESCKELYYIPRFRNAIEYLLNLILIKFKWLSKINGDYEKCFIASIDNIYVQYILGKINFKKLYTFDDGTANIARGSIYYKPVKDFALKKIMRQLFFVSYNQEKIKQLSQCHYTIYRSFPNIIENTSLVYLFQESEFLKVNADIDCFKVIHIFLGQPVKTVNKDYDIEKIESIISQLPIDYYYPHPFETEIPSKYEIIKSPLIFEDYLKDQIKLNPDVIYKIYSFGSSVLLNIKEYPNTELFYIYDCNLFERLSSLYDLYDKAGISKVVFIDI